MLLLGGLCDIAGGLIRSAVTQQVSIDTKSKTVTIVGEGFAPLAAETTRWPLLAEITPTVLLALLAAPLFAAWLYWTRAGLAVRAVGESVDAARLAAALMEQAPAEPNAHRCVGQQRPLPSPYAATFLFAHSICALAAPSLTVR